MRLQLAYVCLAASASTLIGTWTPHLHAAKPPVQAKAPASAKPKTGAKPKAGAKPRPKGNAEDPEFEAAFSKTDGSAASDAASGDEKSAKPEAEAKTAAPESAERPSVSKPRSGSGPKAHVTLENSLYYDTEDVGVLSPMVAGGVADEVAGWSVNGSYLVDVVTAASVDIVSTASPHWVELRHVGALNGSVTLDPVVVGGLAVVSREPDYLSMTGGATFSVDLLDKNVTPYGALSLEIDRVGQTHLPHEFWKDKHVISLQAGVTLVLGRATIGSVQLDGSFERGYLAKPYRYVPLFAPGQGVTVPAGATIADVNQYRLDLRPAERLPSGRDRYALSGHLAHRIDNATLRLDERLYYDSWGLLGATTELRYIAGVAQHLEVWPHVRHHIQSGVDFWKRAYEAVPLADGSLAAPQYRAGDRELGPLQTFILGAGARYQLTDAPGSEWALVLEADVGRTNFSDALYILRRNMAYATLAVEATF